MLAEMWYNTVASGVKWFPLYKLGPYVPFNVLLKYSCNNLDYANCSRGKTRRSLLRKSTIVIEFINQLS